MENKLMKSRMKGQLLKIFSIISHPKYDDLRHIFCLRYTTEMSKSLVFHTHLLKVVAQTAVIPKVCF